MATPPITELFVAAADVAAKTAEAAGLPKIAINKVSCEWLQILAEGWASPMTGFMREKEFLKCIHFNQIDGVNQSVPIVLPINAEDNRYGCTPMSSSRVIAPIASFVCNVESTRCPVSDA